jgi:hypothetical protein
MPAFPEVLAGGAVRSWSVKTLTGTTWIVWSPSDRSSVENATTAQTQAVNVDVNNFILCCYQQIWH